VKDTDLCRVCNLNVGQSAAAQCQVCRSRVHYSCGVICRTCWTYVCRSCAELHYHFIRRPEQGRGEDSDEDSWRPHRGDENHLRLLVLVSLVEGVTAIGPSGDAWSWFDLAVLVLTILAAVGVHRIATMVRQICARKTRTIGTQSQTTYRGRFIPLGEAQQGAWPAPVQGQ
jgi:hypothetical protein